MSVHTKERPIDSMNEYDDNEFILWREAFPELKDEDLPRVYLQGARARECMTQTELSKRTGIPQRHISEMENGKRPIDKAAAQKMSEVLGCHWENMITL